jgi:uncharacterized membrane protein YccF (DUF307 family)
MSVISLLLNLLWIVFGGLWMVIAAVVMAIAIVGLPWARPKARKSQHLSASAPPSPEKIARLWRA